MGREELGLKGISIWAACLGLSLLFGRPYVFVVGEALLDIVLAYLIFGGNINRIIR